MTKRRSLGEIPTPPALQKGTTYQVWLTKEQHDAVELAISKFEGGWAEWVDLAMKRLLREEPVELKSILGGIKRASRAGKQIQSFRINGATLDQAKQLVLDFDSNIQTVLATAFFMQSLAPLSMGKTQVKAEAADRRAQ